MYTHIGHTFSLFCLFWGGRGEGGAAVTGEDRGAAGVQSPPSPNNKKQILRQYSATNIELLTQPALVFTNVSTNGRIRTLKRKVEDFPDPRHTDSCARGVCLLARGTGEALLPLVLFLLVETYLSSVAGRARCHMSCCFKQHITEAKHQHKFGLNRPLFCSCIYI